MNMQFTVILLSHMFADEIESRNEGFVNEELSPFKSNADILKDYAENATIQGLIYIFFPYQTHFGKLFWAIVVLLLLALGFYWCVTVYLNWTANPVLTTITTTAYSVKKVS
jgi:hypothetical protein